MKNSPILTKWENFIGFQQKKTPHGVNHEVL